MKNRIPDGDPVLCLNDEEHKTLCAFCEEYAKRTDLPHTTLETHAPLAALLCFLRKQDPPLPDFTGKVILWVSGKKRIIADCIQQVGELCITPAGTIHASRAVEHYPGTLYGLNWPPDGKTQR